MDKIAKDILKKICNESKSKIFKRLSIKVAKGNKKLEKDFFKMMNNFDFLPNSTAMMNKDYLSCSFVLPLKDSLRSIYKALDLSSKIHNFNGGIGFNFSNIKPKGKSPGVVSLLRLFNSYFGKAKGKRPAANMAILNVDHPDIIEFINAKNLDNFNLSVAVNDKFMNKKKKKIWNEIIKNTWLDGNPGLIFIDEINRKHPLKEKVKATDACGEQPLLDYESSNLGSINLSNFVKKKDRDFEKLQKTVYLAVEFLDNLIDINKYPSKEIEKITKENRKIGLGVMGFAEMLIKLNVDYRSQMAMRIAKNTMNFINFHAIKKSKELAIRKGSFPNIKNSNLKQMRNATLTTIAPTGTLSLIAGTTPSIEPLFAVKQQRTFNNKKYIIKNKLYGKYPRKLFVTFDKVKPEQHVIIQHSFQKYCSNAVSKTVNLSYKSSKKDVEKIFNLAYKLKCKGITVYRDKSRK